MEKLKPCPFCGGKAVPVYYENGSGFTSNLFYASKKCTIKCEKCGIVAPHIYAKASNAIKYWNRRVSDG